MKQVGGWQGWQVPHDAPRRPTQTYSHSVKKGPFFQGALEVEIWGSGAEKQTVRVTPASLRALPFKRRPAESPPTQHRPAPQHPPGRQRTCAVRPQRQGRPRRPGGPGGPGGRRGEVSCEAGGAQRSRGVTPGSKAQKWAFFPLIITLNKSL